MKNKLHFIALTFLFTTIAIAKGNNTTSSLWNAKNNSATSLVTNPPTGNPSQTFCAGMTLANIQVTGTAIKWYAAASGGSVLPSTTTLINNTSYYASQTVAGIESTTRLQITVTVNPIIIPTFTPVNPICPGQFAPILPTTSDNGIEGTWNPPGISNTSSGMYTFTPTLTMAPGPDLVVNGNFSAGNTGFTTNYQYLTVSTPSGAQKTYGIVTNPQVWFTPFSSCPDHTSGTGKMMVVDGSGSNAGNDILWSQTIPVTAGENYTFSYYLQTIATPNPAQIEVVINGTIVGTATAGTTTCNWVQYSYVWNSAANTSAQISLYDRNVAANGNDFAIDDLSFKQNTSLCATNATMMVTVNPLPTATILGTPTIICPGEQAWVNIIGTPNATVTYNVNGGTPQTIVLDAIGNSFLVTFPLTFNTTYTLMSVTSNGTPSCTQTLFNSTTINVMPLPTAIISGTTTICPGNATTVTFTGTPNATVTYTENGGTLQTIVLNATGTASLTTPSLTANSTYTLVSITSNGTPSCTQPLSGIATINVIPLPTDVVIESATTCLGNIALIFFHGQPNTIVNFTIQNSSSGPINLTLDAEGNGIYNSFDTFVSGDNFIVGNSVTNSLGCSIVSYQSAVISVLPIPVVTQTTYELCDDNNDGVECFDLHSKDSEICPNCESQGTSVSYYLDANFTTPLPNIYCNTVNPQVIYAVAVNNGCISTTSMTLQATSCTPINGDVSITSSNNTIGLLDTITVNVQLTNATDLYSLFMKLKGNAAVSQYLDYAGYTVGTLLGTGGSVIATTPTVTNGMYDFGITKVGAVPGYSGSGLFYSFRFVTKNSPIPTGTTFCFYLDEVSAYNTSGVSCALTNQGQYCYTFTNQVDVWPGDLNNSNTVTTADILPIGYFYNATGPARTNTNIQWSAHPATLWGYNHASINGDAYKVFADSNGDGVINNADQAAIGFNMNQTHAKTSVPTLDLFSAQTRQTLAAGDLIVSPDTAIINGATLPQTVTFTVSLNSTGGLSSLYGIATNLLFDATIFDLSTATIDFTGSIFGTTDTDCLVINYVSASIVSVGMTRYANAAINGQGLLFKVTLQTKPTIAPLTQTQVSAAVEAANNQAGDALVIQEASLTTLNIINNLGINEVQNHNITVYPNPAKEQITIQMSPTTFIKQIQLIDMLGRIIKTEYFTSSNTTATLYLNEVAKGTYFIEVISDTNQKGIKKILVN